MAVEAVLLAIGMPGWEDRSRKRSVSKEPGVVNEQRSSELCSFRTMSGKNAWCVGGGSRSLARLLMPGHALALIRREREAGRTLKLCPAWRHRKEDSCERCEALRGGLRLVQDRSEWWRLWHSRTKVYRSRFNQGVGECVMVRTAAVLSLRRSSGACRIGLNTHDKLVVALIAKPAFGLASTFEFSCGFGCLVGLAIAFG